MAIKKVAMAKVGKKANPFAKTKAKTKKPY